MIGYMIIICALESNPERCTCGESSGLEACIHTLLQCFTSSLCTRADDKVACCVSMDDVGLSSSVCNVSLDDISGLSLLPEYGNGIVGSNESI